MKHTGFIAVVLVGGIALTAGAAWAQKPGGMHRAPISFEALDKDGNGEITQEEFAGHREARFRETDSNGDGKLGRDEMIASAQKRVEQRVDEMIKRLDADEDGELSLAEMPDPRESRRAGRFFERMDQDESGGVSKAEYDEAREHMGKHHRNKRHKN